MNVCDWIYFLKDSDAKNVPHVTEYNHFEFNVVYKRQVHCRVDTDGNDFMHHIFPLDDEPYGFLDVGTPEGMTIQCKEYLFKYIRAYCKEEYLLRPIEPVVHASISENSEPEPDQPDPDPEP